VRIRSSPGPAAAAVAPTTSGTSGQGIDAAVNHGPLIDLNGADDVIIV
jgi:hypothetical protein